MDFRFSYNHWHSVYFTESSLKEYASKRFPAHFVEISQSFKFHEQVLIFIFISCHVSNFFPFVEKINGASTNLLQTFPRFTEIFWRRCSHLRGISDKNTRARERPRPLLVPTASFRALWCRILERGRRMGEGEEGRRPGFLATVGVIPFFDNDHSRPASARYHTLPSPPQYFLPTHLPPQSRYADLSSA